MKSKQRRSNINRLKDSNMVNKSEKTKSEMSTLKVAAIGTAIGFAALSAIYFGTSIAYFQTQRANIEIGGKTAYFSKPDGLMSMVSYKKENMKGITLEQYKGIPFNREHFYYMDKDENNIIDEIHIFKNEEAYHLYEKEIESGLWEYSDIAVKAQLHFNELMEEVSPYIKK